MKPKYLLALFSLMLLLLASGCFQVQQDMWVNPDGSGKMVLDIGVDESFLSMVNQTSPSSNPFADWQNMEQAASKDSNITKFTTSESSENGIHHFVANIETKSFMNYTEAIQAGSDFKVTKLDNGNLRYSQTLSFANGQGLSGVQAGMSDMLAEALKEDYYIVRVHVPVIVSADPSAAVNGKTNTAEWKVPMKDLLMDQKKVDIWLEYKTAAGGLPVNVGWVIAGVVLLILAGGAFYFMRQPRTMPAPVFDVIEREISANTEAEAPAPSSD